MSKGSRNRSSSRERCGSGGQRLKSDHHISNSQSLDSSSTEIIIPEGQQKKVPRYHRSKGPQLPHGVNGDGQTGSQDLLISRKKQHRDSSTFPDTRISSQEKVSVEDKKAGDRGPKFFQKIPGSNLATLMKKVPESSYREVNTLNTMTYQKATWMDIFLTDFFFIRAESEKYCLMYIYVPSMSEILAHKVQEIQNNHTPGVALPAYQSLIAQTEDMFVRENHGIDEGNKDEVIRVAFRMIDGRLDDHCRRFLCEFPIMSLATNTNWPVVRIMFLQSCPLKATPFLKKGCLSKTEWKLLNSGTLLTIASSLLFLDRGEIGRVIALAGEHYGEVPLNTLKYLSDSGAHGDEDPKSGYNQTYRPGDIRVNGRVTLRFALNQTTVPRRMLYKCHEIAHLIQEAKKIREEASAGNALADVSSKE